MLARLRAADCHGMISCLERVKHRYPAPEKERAEMRKRWPILMLLIYGWPGGNTQLLQLLCVSS
jgi:hypothetical protein